MKLLREPLPQPLVDAFAQLVFEEWAEDWHDVQAKDHPELILGEEDGELCVGGAVFIEKSPEDAGPKALREQFKARPYLGYLLVPGEKRGQGYASQWLQHVLEKFPNAWLVCEKSLESFYEKFGFSTEASFPGEEGEEVLMVSKNS